MQTLCMAYMHRAAAVTTEDVYRFFNFTLVCRLSEAAGHCWRSLKGAYRAANCQPGMPATCTCTPCLEIGFTA